MIYTMNRMATQLYLNADLPGTFLGMSSHFSGDGFADMQFNVEALPKDGFSAWIDETRKAPPRLSPRKPTRISRSRA
jgi:Heme/copper-type cytochrome/quinol oxidases, subunit 2